MASPKYYVNELEFKAEIEKGYVEIKKKYTFDRGVWSKVLVIYAVEEKAKEISLKLQQIVSRHYKYILYKNTTAQERLATMQVNDMMNISSRYEILYDA